jgi:hypothetical protein
MMVLSLWEVNSERGGGDFLILCCVLRMSPLYINFVGYDEKCIVCGV